METKLEKETKPKAHHNLRWIIITFIIGAILIALLVIQPWNFPVNPHDVLDKAYTATSQVESFRASHTIISSGYESEHTTIEFISPECYHATRTQVYFITELIVIGDERYFKGNSQSAIDIDRLVTYTISMVDETNISSLVDNLSKLEKFPAETLDGVFCAHYLGKQKIELTLIGLDLSMSNVGIQTGLTITGLNPNMPNYELLVKALEQTPNWNREMEFWISKKDNLIRQIKSTNLMTATLETQPSTSIVITFPPGGTSPPVTFIYEFHDFNEPITVEPPLNADGQLLPGWEKVE